MWERGGSQRSGVWTKRSKKGSGLCTTRALERCVACACNGGGIDWSRRAEKMTGWRMGDAKELSAVDLIKKLLTKKKKSKGGEGGADDSQKRK